MSWLEWAFEKGELSNVWNFSVQFVEFFLGNSPLKWFIKITKLRILIKTNCFSVRHGFSCNQIQFSPNRRKKISSKTFKPASVIKNDKRKPLFCWRWSTVKLGELAENYDSVVFFLKRSFDDDWNDERFCVSLYCLPALFAHLLPGKDHFAFPSPKPHQNYENWNVFSSFPFWAFGFKHQKKEKKKLFLLFLHNASISCPLRFFIVLGYPFCLKQHSTNKA